MKKAKLHEADTGNERNAAIDWLELFGCDPSLNTLPSPPKEFVIHKSKLEEALFDYFSDVVPTLLEEARANGLLKYTVNAKPFEEKICKQLEYFIVGEVAEEGINGLSVYNKPKKFCGKVFDVGDLTYTCKSCAQDPTCVFCHFCFYQSVHKDHKYKLHASNGGGGYCDCGDEEAWTNDPACDYHKDGMQNDESWDPFSALPIDVQHRATFVFLFVLQYCMELLLTQEITDEDEIVLPSPLQIKTNDLTNSHVVMLYNDESHTYEDVISTLGEAVKCNRQQAFHFAAVVDKEGRSSIYSGVQRECGKVVADCKKLTSRNGKLPLKCKSMHRDVAAHQLVALHLMSWMNEVVNVSDGLRRLLCLISTSVLTGITRDWSMSFLELVIREDTSLWKVARTRSHQLFMNAVLMDTLGRKEFTITFAKCYKKMFDDFMKDDHEHSISVAALSVQIFTVPSLANMLMAKYNILKICLETFLEKVILAVGKNGYLDFQDNPNLVNMRRASFILHDVEYLLRHKPEWSPELFDNFLDAFDVFVDILKIMQGMDAVTRKTLSHVAYEPNYETAFTLQLGMILVLGSMLTWCCSNADILKAATHRCLLTLRSLPLLKYSTLKKFVVVNHDVSSKLVSIHYALSRFLAGLLTGASKYSLNIRDFYHMEDNQNDSTIKLQLQLLEYPLRSLVLSAQVNAQMWKRNGYAILHQLFYYHNSRFVSEMYDRDILMLQALACLMNGDHLIIAMAHKYNLVNWATEVGIDEKGEPKEKESMLAKDFLLLLIHILSERYVIGVSDITTAEIMEREIIHRLSLGAIARSALVKHLPNKDPDIDDDTSFELMVDDILKKVAVYREPSISGKGVFELKPEIYTRCSKYFMHFTRTEQFKMVEEKKRIDKKLSNEEVQFFPALPKFHANFKDVIKLLCSKKMLRLLEVVIKRALKGYRYSEDHIEEVLIIVAIGILEEKRCRNDLSMEEFEFIKLLREKNEKSIGSLIHELAADDSKAFFPIVRWVKQLLQDEVESGGSKGVDVKKRHSNKTTSSKEDEKAEKARLSKERKQKMMNQMNEMQKAFMKNNKSLFESCELSEEPMEDDSYLEDLSHPVAIGSKHSNVDNTSMSALCILCQEEQTIDGDNFFIITAFLHKSKLMKVSNEKKENNLMPKLNSDDTVNVSSCGHIAHIQCWEKYFNSVKEREGLPFFQRHQRSCIDINEAEYLCPLCNSLCNTVLPLLPRAPVTQCCDSEDMSLSEFLTYLERFSAEMVCSVKKDVAQAKPTSNSNLASFFTLLSSYVGSNMEKPSSENSMELFARKLMKVFSNADPKQPPSFSVPYSWMACSHTLQAYECSARTNETNVFSSISERQDIFWHALVQYLASNCMIGIYEPIQEFGNILFNFFCNVDSENSLSILDADICGVMISLRFLVACIQNIYQEEEPRLMNTPLCLIDDVVFRVCLIANLVKIYLSAPLFLDECSEFNDNTDDNVVESWRYIQNLAHLNCSSPVNPFKLKEHVLKSILPFMRCAALFFHYLTGVKLPANLTADAVIDELATLQKYLNLPEDINDILSLKFLIAESLVQQMVESWCKHEDIAARGNSVTSVACFGEARRLITLPKEYSSLINMAAGFRCPTLNDASCNPALCLLCGTILCSQCYCCVNETEPTQKFGPCSNHSMACSAGIGIFLRIRASEIVLMYNRSKGSLMPSPYLDEYGETDRGFRRGNPLYLNERRYKSIEQLWLRQKIPETIAQAMETDRHLNSQDWAQF